MRSIERTMIYFLFMVFMVTALASCTSLPELNVSYRLPPGSDELKGRKIFLAIEDKRATREILGETAKKEFQGFSGNISFSLARDTDKGFKLGLYDLKSLFREAFIRRFENMGLIVVSKREESHVELVIVVNEFVLDLVGRNWVTSMGYEARLEKDGSVRARQKRDGQAERIKLVGRSQADIMMGDIFTDIVNSLDVDTLFMHTGQ